MNIRVDDDTVIAGRHVATVKRVHWETGARVYLYGRQSGEWGPEVIWASDLLPEPEADVLFSKCSASLVERSAD